MNTTLIFKSTKDAKALCLVACGTHSPKGPAVKRAGKEVAVPTDTAAYLQKLAAGRGWPASSVRS